MPLIVLPIDPSTLPQKISTAGVPAKKVPIDRLLDDFAWMYYDTYGYQPCAHMLNPAINRDVKRGGYGPDPFLVSANRRVLYTRPDGRKILLHTKSSRTDFADGSRTPGVIP